MEETKTEPAEKKERATELEWLRWFYQHADFGPADGDIRMYMERDFKRETKKELPEGYEEEW